MKKKLCVFVENDFILRSYLETQIFQKISDKYSIELILTHKTNSNLLSGKNSFPIFCLEKIRFYQLFQTVISITYWFKKQKQSNSFAARILSLKLSRRIFYSKKKSGSFPSFAIVIGLLFARKNFEVPVKFFSLASRRFWKFLKKSNPDLIICITSGAATSNSDLLSFVGKKLRIPVLSVVENWDNLTSKAVFNIKPDFIGVWGIKDKQAAIELHDIPEESVFMLGSPRVSQMLKNRPKSSVLGENLLFAGGSIDIEDELIWLDCVLRFATALSIPVIYVPHPSNYNDLSQIIDSRSDIHALIPTEIIGLVLKGGFKRYPKLNFYEEILRKSKVAISPYSTLLLESLLYGIHGVGIDFQDPLQIMDGWASEKLEHLTQLNFFAKYWRATNENELAEILNRVINQIDLDSQIDTERTDELLINPFYFYTENFSQQLILVIEEILN